MIYNVLRTPSIKSSESTFNQSTISHYCPSPMKRVIHSAAPQAHGIPILVDHRWANHCECHQRRKQQWALVNTQPKKVSWHQFDNELCHYSAAVMCSGDIHKKHSLANSQLVCFHSNHVMHLLTKNSDALVLEVASTTVCRSLGQHTDGWVCRTSNVTLVLLKEI